MKLRITILICFISGATVFGQKVQPEAFTYKNSFQLELGGHGLFYSFNYERILLNGSKFKTASQIGFSYYPPSTGIRDIWVPIGVNEQFSYGNHHIEVGLGWVINREAVRGEDNSAVYWLWSNLMSGRVGYRYQKPEGRMVFRVAFTPFAEFASSIDVHPSGGVSLGYCF